MNLECPNCAKPMFIAEVSVRQKCRHCKAIVAIDYAEDSSKDHPQIACILVSLPDHEPERPPKSRGSQNAAYQSTKRVHAPVWLLLTLFFFFGTLAFFTGRYPLELSEAHAKAPPLICNHCDKPATQSKTGTYGAFHHKIVFWRCNEHANEPLPSSVPKIHRSEVSGATPYQKNSLLVLASIVTCLGSIALFVLVTIELSGTVFKTVGRFFCDYDHLRGQRR